MNLDNLFDLARGDHAPPPRATLPAEVITRLASLRRIDHRPFAVLAAVAGVAAAIALSLALYWTDVPDPQESLFPTFDTRIL
jgi:hypothetical protein